MQGKIGKVGLEEHFAIEETINDSAGFVPGEYWVELRARLLDIHENRLRQMDAHGMEMMLLSLNAPTVQAIPDVARAADIARRTNDYLARGANAGRAVLPASAQPHPEWLADLRRPPVAVGLHLGLWARNGRACVAPDGLRLV